MQIIDTHLHLIDPARLSYPWLGDVPALARAFTLDAYFAQGEPLGITRALHVEVDVAPEDRQAETDLVLRLDARILGAVAACRPEDGGFAAELERLAATPGVKGLRRVLHTMPDALSGTPTFTDNVRRLAAAGLPFDLCLLARQLPLGRDLADRCPDVCFVLDHCGNPPIAEGALDAWRADIAAMAERGNVCVKISGMANHAGTGWTAETLRPAVEHVVACFGWDRVVWGSDHPVLTLAGDLAAWVAASLAIVEGCSADEKGKLFAANARRIYSIDAD